MYVALQQLDTAGEAVIEQALDGFLRDTRGLVEAMEDDVAKRAARKLLRDAWESLRHSGHWNACVAALSARAPAMGLEGPERDEWAGRDLCLWIRAACPTAPNGFEKIGRRATGDG